MHSLLKQHQDSTSNQIAVLIIRRLNGQQIEAYTNEMFNQWKLGQQSKNNGVLIVIAVNDHKIRIEVGYGLEETLTDALTSRIIRNEMVPHLKEKQYDAAVTAGVLAIIHSIAGTYTTDEQSRWQALVSYQGVPYPEKWIPAFFIVLFLLVISVIVISLEIPGSWLWFCFVLLFYVFPFAVLGFSWGITMLSLYIFTFLAVKLYRGTTKKKVYRQPHQQSKRASSSTGFYSYSSDSHSSSTSSNSSDGSNSDSFSGDGGSSGGGGASDSW